MNVIFGVGILIVVIGLVLMFVSMSDRFSDLFPLAMVLTVGPILALILAFGLAFIFVPEVLEPSPLQVGACYQAYEENSYVLVGKVVVPVRGVDLVQIACP